MICSSDTETGDSWNIPHDRVYDPSKSEKIMVVYDWSWEYCGRNLNK